jgi:8-oxo-dGTP pyrophosphatase MutT (NUDIX family)
MPTVTPAQEPIRAAGILFVTPELQTLFLKRGNGGDFPGMWNFPGGRLEDGETAIEAAIRETIEEAGYEAKPEDLTVWTRRLAQHETTGAPPTPAEGQIEPSIVETDVLNAPGNAFMATGPMVDFTTFICKVPEPFTPAISDESVGYAWSAIDQAPEPLHPGVRVALDRFGMDELGIARAMQNGDLTSPQFYENVAIFDIRISGTGDAYRTGIEEFVYRPPEAWLNPDLLPRYNGLPVLWLHTEAPVLDTTEFAEKIVGTVMLPYVKGDEVWGIAKVWDMPAAKIMAERQLSTSPGVLFRGKGTNTKLKLEDGRTLLIEGNPDLMDHVAICEMGVWDKGGAPAGVKSSEIIGDAEMTMEDAARKDADTEIEKKEDRKDADLDKFLSKMDAVCARLDAMEASMKDRKDSDEKEAKCDADEDDKSEKKDRKDAKKDGDMDGDTMMTAADKKDAEDDKEKKEEDARKDAELSELRTRLAALEHRTKPVAETDRALFARAQSRADGVMQAFGDAAPRQMQGEELLDYRRRLLSPLLKHSTAWKGVDITALPENALTIAEDQVYKDAVVAARSPANIPSGTLIPVERRDRAGRTITTFHGEPRSWMSAFSTPRRHLTGITTKHEGA